MLNITEHERFTAIHKNEVLGVGGEHYVLKDNETGVLYYMVDMSTHGSGGVGLTSLLDINGKPIIDK